jgi:ubiquinone/menaquinone biosynthesis C-methylase UbiE
MGDFIKDFWEKNAEKYKNSHWASWGDNFAIELEIDNISRFISDGNFVLDAGCANGYSAFKQLQAKDIHIVGVDYSEKMIASANAMKKELGLDDKINFAVDDIRSLHFNDEMFDAVYTTRVLINLPSWEQQLQGIDNCIRVTKYGGTIVLSEAFWEPLILLNSLRALKQLPPLVEHDFNRYLKQKKLEDYLGSKGLRFQKVDFSSVYYLGSRFIRELVTNPGDYPGYTNPINKLFYEIEKDYSGGGFGVQQAYVIRK